MQERGSIMSWLDELEKGDAVLYNNGREIEVGYVTRTTKTQVLVGIPGQGQKRFWKKNAVRVGDASTIGGGVFHRLEEVVS